MVDIDGNGRDGGGRREDIPRAYSSSFHFFYFSLFLSFSPSFFLASFFSFSLFFVLFFSKFLFLKISKEFTQNKDMEELFRGLKRVCQNVKCNV